MLVSRALASPSLRPVGAIVFTPEQAEELLGQLPPGESLVWYSGYLPVDRLYPRKPEAGMGRDEWALRYARERAVNRLAQFMLRQGAPKQFVYNAERAAHEIHGTARGHLSQRRLGPMFYDYVFTRAG